MMCASCRYALAPSCSGSSLTKDMPLAKALGKAEGSVDVVEDTFSGLVVEAEERPSARSAAARKIPASWLSGSKARTF